MSESDWSDYSRLSYKKYNQTLISSYFNNSSGKKIASESDFVCPRRRKRRVRKMSSRSSISSVEISSQSSRSSETLTNSSVYSVLFANIPKRKLPAPIFSDDEDDFDENCSDVSSPSKKNNKEDLERDKDSRVLISLNKPSPVKRRKEITNFRPLRTSTPSVNSQQSEVVTSSNDESNTNKSSLNSPKNKLIVPSKNEQETTEKSINRNESISSSSSSLSPNNSDNNADKTCSRTVTVLENVLLYSPKKHKEVNEPIPSTSKSHSQNDSNNNADKTVSRKITLPVKFSPTKSPQKQISVTNDKKDKKMNYEQLKVLREFFSNILTNSHMDSLLTKDEKEFLQRFFNIDREYQYLCMKLFLWQPIWYNIFSYVEKINLKMEDSDIILMYNFLKDNRFVDTDYMYEDTFTLLNLLGLKAIRDICRNFRISNVAGSKDSLISKLLKHCKTQITLTSSKNAEQVLRTRIKEKMGFCVKLSKELERCLYNVFLLNTFTNPSLIEPQEYFKNVSYFNIVFPDYKIEKFHIFYTTEEFSRYADAVKLRCELQKFIEKRDIATIFDICKCAFEKLNQLNNESGDSFDDSREPHLEKFTPNAQYVYILTAGIKQITTTYFNDVKLWFEYLLSQNFCKHKRGDWYCQLAMIYSVYLKEHEKAARLVVKALKEDKEHFTEVQLHELAHRAKVLNKKSYNIPTLIHDEIASLVPPSCDRDWPQDVLDCNSMSNGEPGRRRTYAHRDDNGDVTYLNVEQTALKYYQDFGYPDGEHCEGNLIVASFCLLFWDIIYERYVKGTFTSHVQNSPLDMYTKHFFTNRERLITKRLNSIKEKWSEDEFKTKLMENFLLHSHENSLCQIDAVVKDPEYLFNILSCIGRPILSKIFSRLVRNYKAYHSGFPDLVVWNMEQKKAKFVEVKSENDILSIKQKLWLNYLIDIGASVAVCRVEPKGSKKKFRSTKM